MSPKLTGPLFVAGRAGLASLFLLGALSKLAAYGETLDRMTAAGLEPADVLLPLTIALEAGGGMMLALGLPGAGFAALALAAFALSTNFAFHRFWELSGEMAAIRQSLFFKNVAIAGGLVACGTVLLQRDRQRGLRGEPGGGHKP
jgi:putative oxidoreductase